MSIISSTIKTCFPLKSKSVSWIAKISKEPGSSTTTSDITMVRIPYNSLISGERYKNLASGLEDVRSKIAPTSSSAIFKSLDNISTHGDFARAVANIRGDVYSNIQERMKTVENSFDKSFLAPKFNFFNIFLMIFIKNSPYQLYFS